MQGQIAIISEGEVRLLGYDPRTKMPTTLDKLKPGEIIGWVNLARGMPCENGNGKYRGCLLGFGQ